MSGDLESWLDDWSRDGTYWYAKRLSGNDTLANRSHQAGPYISKDFLFQIFPQLTVAGAHNPDVHIPLHIDSHADAREVRVIWYNNALWPQRSGAPRGRNETRITGFGGAASPLLNPDSTGAIAVFVFSLDQRGAAIECRAWVCTSVLQEELIEARIGPIEPRQYVTWRPGRGAPTVGVRATLAKASCWLTREEMPSRWLKKFPSGVEIVQKAFELRPETGRLVDLRLVQRRDCEFEVFKSVEEAFYQPAIAKGFSTLNGFLGLAQTILQSRKSRSGKSLELQTHQILTEEGLVPDADFSHGPTIEGNKRPDFLFPSAASYEDPKFPADRLRMLAAKTTVKDRWRQILNEAGRIPRKHLLTLQEGVSENQFREMKEADVQLVVPLSLQDRYPVSVRPHLMSFEKFIAEVRRLRN